jgi:hypothetical protein
LLPHYHPPKLAVTVMRHISGLSDALHALYALCMSEKSFMPYKACRLQGSLIPS